MPRESGFARWVFLIAGVYGLLVMGPMFFLEPQFAHDERGPLTHPEHYYGFVGVGVAWQVAFLIVSRDPVRYRPLMLAAVLEKGSFGVAAVVLFAQQRLPAAVLAAGLIDLLLGALFLTSWRITAPKPPPPCPDGRLSPSGG